MEGRKLLIVGVFAVTSIVNGHLVAQYFYDAGDKAGSGSFFDQSSSYDKSDPFQLSSWSPSAGRLPAFQQIVTKQPQAANATTSSKPCGSCLGECQPYPPQQDEPLPGFLGDFFGLKTFAADRGLSINSAFTQFYQGVAGGGAEQTFRYGGKLDLYADFNLEKMGFWKGSNLLIHVVNWNFGENSNADATFLAPVNTNLLFPTPDRSYAITTFLYQQALGESGWEFLAGRYDLLDFWQTFYPEFGRGIDGFMNASSLVPFNVVVPGLPPVSNLVGIIKSGEQGVQTGFITLETANHPLNIGWNFPNGVTLAGFGRVYTKLFGLRGTHTLLGWYATGDFTAFDSNDWIEYPPGVPGAPVCEGTWSAAYIAEQRLWQDPCNENRYANFFGYLDFADQRHNPFEYTAGGSIETFGFFRNRPLDRSGISYFYNRLGDLSNLLSVIEPAGDVQGGEFYYNAAVRPWINLTFGLQAVQPSFRSRDVAIVPAIRGKITF